MFRIRHAARLAGISPGLLRAWERRYGLVEPRRTESGYRVYSEADVALLSATARLVAAGHSISDVARLTPARIRASADKLETRPATVTATTPHDLEALLRASLHAIAQFDGERLEATLVPVLGTLAPAAACEEVLTPLLRRIGEGWERGAISVAAEHFGTALVRGKILQYLQFLARPGQGARVVCACPDEERHEGGLLSFAVHAAASGWDVVYLGATTPLTEALDTALRVDAAALALSLTRAAEDVRELAATLGAFARKHPRPRILVGGRAAVARRNLLEGAGLVVADQARFPLEDLGEPAARKPRAR